jgi:predicted TIM-barrel fold metal-dependent hydrolase
MRNGYRIADADAHQMEPPEMWERHIEDRFKSAAPRLTRTANGRNAMTVEGDTLSAKERKYPEASMEFQAAAARAMRRFSRARRARYSVESRLADMDEEGVDVQILYPTAGAQLLGREFRDVDLLAACCRAYNDWSGEYCSAAPARLRWAAMLPIQGMMHAIEEVDRATSNGAAAFFVRPNPVRGRNLHHRCHWPLFAAIERTGKPITIHDSSSPYLPSFGDRMETHTTGHLLAHPFEAMAAMAGLIWFGVLERFPGLRVVHVEADAGWVPYWLQRMDQHWEYSGGAEHPDLKMTPSQYFRRNFLVACRADEPTLKPAIELIGDDNFVWNTDYPHPDGTWPWALENIEALAISHLSKRKILWDNAARAFGFD